MQLGSAHVGVAAVGTVAGTFTTPPVVALAPVIESVSAVWAECCERVTLSGRGLANPLGVHPVVKLNGRQVTVTASSPTSATFEMPYPSPNQPGPATLTLEHAVGTATAATPFIVVTDPSAITSISPAQISAGVPTTVTVQGTNLARARGICLPGASQTGPFVLRTDQQPSSNTEFAVVVTAAAGLSGAIAVAVPPNISQRQYTICQANPTPVQITIQ